MSADLRDAMRSIIGTPFEDIRREAHRSAYGCPDSDRGAPSTLKL